MPQMSAPTWTTVPLRERAERLGHGLVPILQTAGAAAVAYLISTELLGHERPIFAPLAAVIALGATRGQHWERAIQMVLGVAVGIGVADLLVLGIGRGSWQVGLVAALAMGLAVFLGGGSMVVTQAAISAILVATIDPVTEFVPTRFFDALVGGGVALIVSQLLFPVNPRTAITRAAQPVFEQLVVTLRQLADAMEVGDVAAVNRALARARDTDSLVRAFNDALSQGHEIARLAPPRRRERGQMEIYAVAATRVDLAVRNTRVLARAARGLVRLSGPAPPPVVRAVRGLADGVEELGRHLDAPEEAEATRDLARDAVIHATSVLDDPAAVVLSSVVGQIRLTASDLLRATGATLADAQRILDEAIGIPTPED